MNDGTVQGEFGGAERQRQADARFHKHTEEVVNTLNHTVQGQQSTLENWRRYLYDF